MLSGLISEITKAPDIIVKKLRQNFCKGRIEEGGSPVKFQIAWGEDYIILQMNRKCLSLMQAIVLETREPDLYWQIRTWTGMKHCIAWYNDEKQRENICRPFVKKTHYKNHYSQSTIV